MQDHTGINCPYVREITSLQERIPPGFAQDWGAMQQKVEQIHDALFKNGVSGRLRKAELDIRWVIASVSIVLLTYAGVIGFIIYSK